MTNYRSAVGAQQPSTLVLDGISISYTDSGGSGPVVICLHAIGHGARDFEDLSRRLSPQNRVIAVDFPNQGIQARIPSPPALPATPRSSRNASTSCIFQGLCCLATPLAEPFPSVTPASIPNASRLLCCAIVVDSVLPVPSALSLSGAFVQFFAAGRRGAFWFPWAFDRYYRRVLLKPAAHEERDRIIRSAYEIAPTLEQAWRSFNRPKENLALLLPHVRCPVLLAWAKDDFVVPLKRSAPSFQVFPNHRLEVFEGGHAAFLEDPGRFEQGLRAF